MSYALVKTEIGEARVEAHYRTSRNENEPVRSVSIRFGDVKINGKKYENITAGREMYRARMWQDDNEAALSWNSWIVMARNHVPTSNAHSKILRAASAAFEVLNQGDWTAALVEYRKTEVEAARKTLLEATEGYADAIERLKQAAQGVTV